MKNDKKPGYKNSNFENNKKHNERPASPASLGGLKIIFENDDYIVIDKPSGIVVNKSDTTNAGVTLQDLIVGENIIDKNEKEEEFLNKAGIVHRLDKETSGVLIIAKNAKTFKDIQSQFKARSVEKTYIALVHGSIKPGKGEINAPVGRLPWNRKRFGVIAQGREATTSYEVISNFKSPPASPSKAGRAISNEILSLVRLFPKTGRTHQIRVHLKHIGHPIFSDPVYGGRKTSRNDRKILSRIFLHASDISFNDPDSNERVTFKRELPLELLELLKKLEKLEK